MVNTWIWIYGMRMGFFLNNWVKIHTRSRSIIHASARSYTLPLLSLPHTRSRSIIHASAPSYTLPVPHTRSRFIIHALTPSEKNCCALFSTPAKKNFNRAAPAYWSAPERKRELANIC